MYLSFTIVLSILFIPQTRTIWPPPYRIHLNHTEEFVIFETFGGEDADDDILYSDEDEMIKPLDIRSIDISKDSAKYYRIHKLAMKLGKKGRPTARHSRRIKWPEINYDKEEDQPWVAGHFVNNESNIISENSNVYYLNEMAKRQLDYKIETKRSQNEVDQDYDYASFKKEYENDMKKAKGKNDTLDFVDVTEEESFKDVMKSMINFTKTPRNCTEEEIKGIGMAAVECFWYDFKKVETKEQKVVLLQRIAKVVLFWILVYIVIAVPCWCQKGWCCCCFQCRVCKPRLRIDEVKKFIADNPPGVYHEHKKKLTYKPTHYEKYAHKRLEQALLKL
ncbi:defective proboscis extension response dpr -related [Holotrichia oblita]|uniref:Defective proboscis extension response dpr -related n=1 Tax=Holotrichia oblita TaxID=644536 RepID=A0ACB9TQ62_HOLOL|nr:defective proboscis extension response dpr -related [Holotrichia oblita]